MKLSKIAKSPLTYIAIAAAIITAFAAGLFASARMNGIAASGPREVREVVVDKTDSIIYRNPDGTWPSPVPTSVPLSGQNDDYDAIMEPYATGVATMGKLLYLAGGGSVQLPSDVYVERHVDGGGSCDTWPNCPEFPIVVLARGDDRAAIDRYGKPFRIWSVSSESAPSIDSFKFLNE